MILAVLTFPIVLILGTIEAYMNMLTGKRLPFDIDLPWWEMD